MSSSFNNVCNLRQIHDLPIEVAPEQSSLFELFRYNSFRILRWKQIILLNLKMVKNVTVFCHIAVGLKRNCNFLFFAHSETGDLKKERLRIFVVQCIKTEMVSYFQGMKNWAIRLDLVTLLIVGSRNQFKSRFLLKQSFIKVHLPVKCTVFRINNPVFID